MKARWLIVSGIVVAALAVGVAECGPASRPELSAKSACDPSVPDASASSLAPLPAPSGSTAPASTSKLDEARKPPPFPITLTGPDASHQWTIEAVHGLVDETLVLTAGQPPSAAAAAPSKESVVTHVTAASLGADIAAPLALEGIDGSPRVAVEMMPGEQAVLHLRGRGFSRVDTYRSTLTVAGTVYTLHIHSTSPFEPLGLRASELQATSSNVPVFGDRQLVFAAVIPVDSAGIGGGMYHVAVRPPDHAAPGAQRLPICGVAVTRASDHTVKLSMPPLEAGQYQGVVEIQGEPLVVDLTLKNDWLFVVALVVFGAALSFAGRGYLNYRLDKERNENAIRAAEAKYEKVKSAIAWDDLQVRNGLRHARGSNRILGMADVDSLLADVVPRARPELRTIQDALAGVSLPESCKTGVKRRLTRLLRLSSRADEETIARGLAALAVEAQAGFVPSLRAWLDSLEDHIKETASRVQPRLSPPEFSAVEARRAQDLFALLRQLVADARDVAVADDSVAVLDARHADFLGRIEPALATIDQIASREQGTAALIDLLDCKLPAAALAPPHPARVFPTTLRIQASPEAFDTEPRAHEEINFQLVQAAPDGNGPDTLYDPEDCDLAWRANGEVEVAKGSARITYVFESWSIGMTRKQRVEVFANRQQLAVWEEPIHDAWSVAFQERRATVVARFGVTLLGMAVASAATVALYWTNKPFGSMADYMTPLSIGFGADLTIVGAGTKLLDGILGTLKKRLGAEEKA